MNFQLPTLNINDKVFMKTYDTSHSDLGLRFISYSTAQDGEDRFAGVEVIVDPAGSTTKAWWCCIKNKYHEFDNEAELFNFLRTI